MLYKVLSIIKQLNSYIYLDGIDGKQARRTGTSGPLGELFDHGLDSYTAGLIPVAMYSIFGRGARYSVPPFRMFFTLCNVLNNFYLTHFEKYNTGVMFLPWGYDFTMCGMIVVFLITGVSFFFLGVSHIFWLYSWQARTYGSTAYLVV